jgi:hypothetical protein
LITAEPKPPWFRIGSWGAPATLLLLVVHGCGQTVEVGRDDALSTGGVAAAAGSAAGGTLDLAGTGGANAVAGSAAQAGAPACEKTLCRGKEYQCGNCADDDADGLSDSLDPDCLGPCDDDELGLSTGLSAKQTGSCKQDCYFDGDNGTGNDKCEWSPTCDPLSVAPDYPPSGDAGCEFGAKGFDCAALAAAQPQTCIDVCMPLVPNGCDCFGCCELPGGSGQYHFIGTGSGAQGCQRDALDDAVLCPPCTPVPSCLNDCAKCETCIDKLPDPSCRSGSACPTGAAECGPDAPCTFGDYCVTGCCRAAPPT